jgi:hypothetical protein
MIALFRNLGVSVTSYTAQYTNYFAGSTITRAALSSAINAGAKTLYGEYTDGAHDIWTKTYNDPLLAQWLFLQHKSPAVHTIEVSELSRNAAASKNVYPVYNGSNISFLFAGLKAGQQYELRVFDARGVMTGKFSVAASPASQNAVKKSLATATGMRWVAVKKL